MCETFHFDKMSLGDAAVLAQVLWQLGDLTPQDAVDIATRALVEGFDGPALRQLAGAQNPGSDCEVATLFDRAWREMGLGPVTEDEALKRAAKLVTAGVAGGTVDPYYGATWIGSNLWSTTHEEELGEFVALACFCDDWPEERDRYVQEIVEAARKYAESM